MKIISKSAAQTEEMGELLAKELTGKEVVALFGDLGAGKTAFTRGVAKYCKVRSGVSSPTFAIVHEYDGEKFKIYHFDMYRINSYEDLESTGFFDYLDKGVLIIEWSENIVDFLPADAIKVKIEKSNDENQRVISIEGVNLSENIGN